jgi:hypothetical protein
MAAIGEMIVNVKFNTVYVCSKCGKNETGDTVRAEFRPNTSGELKYLLDSIQQTSHHMPIGWSYNGQFNCGCDK